MIRKHLWLLFIEFFALIQNDASAEFTWTDICTEFTQYSGFLSIEIENCMHYLYESQNNPSTDPLVLWFNDASGCNSLDVLLAQIGLFCVDQDEESAFENIYS
ncbi:hypothetical protein X798_07507 [Onchocerca flexuosa]|uniref:Uncharacterized protein n=1 Tax=Onchocerca flexuosa TaxID=387005 RepID=A0A238BJ81_9BILA|nr:hypothetical protein X798_07507 [Onchocerca flexuosa]